MTTLPTETAETSLAHDLLRAPRYYLGGRRGLLILAGVALLAGLTLNWSWLMAAGIAPILLSVLPCAAMCALGICMNKMSGKSCATEANASESAAMATREVSPDRSPAALPSGAIEAPRPIPESQPFK